MQELIIYIWNWLVSLKERKESTGLLLGQQIIGGSRTKRFAVIPHALRSQHIAILGKTGMGKSSLIRQLIAQDVKEDRGFAVFDIHGDLTPFVLRCIAERERITGRDLSNRLVVIDPSDAMCSVGLNILTGSGDRFTRIAELVDILRRRFQLDAFGARTEELLRNSLLVLTANNLTLLELVPFLTNAPFRAMCLEHETNAEIQSYFKDRFGRLSPAGKAIYSEAVLNKVSAFTGDLRFRHIVGQQTSSFEFAESMDARHWVVINLDKGKLGIESLTLGSLLLTQAKNALFSRQKRSVFTLYCDEVQNLVSYESGLEVLLSEARKYAVSVCSANQYLEQYPREVRAALMAIGTHIYFQVSGDDAGYLARILSGGAPLLERLTNLPARHFLYKIGSLDLREAEAFELEKLDVSASALLTRSNQQWARGRGEIEREIMERRNLAQKGKDESLMDWS